MANPKLLPRPYSGPKIPGGVSRASRRVKLSKYPVVALRQALNSRLQSATCAFTPASDNPLRVTDVELLSQVVSERFSGEHALLRSQAIRQLGRMQVAASIDLLVGLAMSPLENDGMRAAATSALEVMAPRVAEAVLATLPHERGELMRQTVAAASGKKVAGRTRERIRQGQKRSTRRRTPARDSK